MAFFIGNSNTSPEPDSDTAFLDALVSYSSDNDSNYVGAGALRNADVFTAIKIIASDIASNPLENNDPTRVNILNVKPNSVMNGFNFKFALACNLLLNGNAFAEVVMNGNRLRSLEFLPNNKVTVTQDDVSGRVAYYYQQTNVKRRQIASSNILHFKYFTQDGVTGISPLFALKDQLQIQKSGNGMLRGFFQSGVNGTSILKVHKSDLSKEAKDNIRNKFEESNSGNNALRTVVLDDSMDLSNLTVNTDVLKLVNGNDWSTRQIAEVFGIPPERLGVENEHSSNEQSNILYLQNSLGHYFDVFTSELNNKLAGVYTFNTDRLFSSDPKTNQDLAVEAYQGGVLTRNEARTRLGMNTVADGDTFYTKESDLNNGRPQIND
ncbi:phage portal protein [Pediococcus claussenii]|uniref:Prophage Lp3 protein 17, portal protein n=1 Tax=Pediococcus claussenii (strain ATCC BAA-344 / DSM 14800 / JCM 18046 / KCTC 3811 / LMG 21948 / P06) TaxID=701521 RepID=G8PCB2_PEDCP|nr:phage portal protein [Pediococcus claussenii]AEV94897.1 prophage Lp3 protein 17, portal protein [Pediococcus claussenii ATCC BAA-344]